MTVEDLFRREFGHLVAALVRVLGPANVELAEDVVHDALITAMHAWRFEVPNDPKAWILRVAKNRAIDVLRRDRRLSTEIPEREVELALSPEADDENQLAMMFQICDHTLSVETHVSLILRLQCGLSAGEISRAFLCDVPTIDRRLHRGRARLQEAGLAAIDVRARQPSVEHALYVLFSEGYQGSDPDNPLHPALCSDALRLAELLSTARSIDARSTHALAALFCFGAARLATRLDDDGVLVPLADQDRSRWDRTLVARGLAHLAESATGDSFTRWHLEAGIAFEHVSAPSVEATRWDQIVAYYDRLPPSPIVALNRAIALAEHAGLAAGLAALEPLATDPKLARYSFYWAARGDLSRRAGLPDARAHYERAIALAVSRAERESYLRRVR